MAFKGYNAVITQDGIKYDVQTQALANDGIIVSQIFLNGGVIFDQKENYFDAIVGKSKEDQESTLNPFIQLLHRKTLLMLPDVASKRKDAMSTPVEGLEKKLKEKELVTAFLGEWSNE